MMIFRFDRIVPLFLFASLAVSPSTILGQPTSVAGPEGCALDPGVETLLARCAARIETGAACALARTSRALVYGDESGALELLQRELGFDATGAVDLLPAFRLLGLFAVGPYEPMSTCAARASGAMMVTMQEVMVGLKPDNWLVLWPFLGWNETLLPVLEAQTMPARLDAIRRSRVGIERFLEASNNSAAFAMVDQIRDLLHMVAGGKLETRPIAERSGITDDTDLDGIAENSEEQIATAQIDRALKAGIAALTTGQSEAAIRQFLIAEGELERRVSVDTRTRVQLRLAHWLQIVAYRDLGQREFVQRLSLKSEASVHRLDSILDLLGQTLVDGDATKIGEIWPQIVEHSRSDPEGAKEIEVLLQTLGAVIPGIPDLGLSVSGGQRSANAHTENLDAGHLPPSARPSGDSFPQVASDALADLLAGDYDAAARRALQLLDRFPHHSNLGLLFNVVLKQWQAGKRREALANGLLGLERMESIVAGIEVEEIRRSFMDAKGTWIYQVVFGLAVEVGDVEVAFDVAERGRAWGLRSRLGSAWQHSRTIERFKPSAEEIEAREALISHEQNREPAESPARDAWHAQRSALRDDFRHQRLERYLTNSGDGKVAEVPALPSSDAVDQWLPSGWSLVSYASYADTLWAFVVRSGKGVRLHALPIDTKTLESLVGEVEMVRPVGGAEPPSRGTARVDTEMLLRSSRLRRLYEVLFAPLRKELTSRGLLIVPLGSMARIPFAALRDDDSFLIEDFELAQIPSIGALEDWQKRQAEKQGSRVEVWGPPANFAQNLAKLPGAERETEEVARFLGVRPRLGEDVKEALLYSVASRIGLLHLATHAEYPVDNPLFSRIHLGASGVEDGFLDFHEVWDRLDLRKAQLVTLSGCETGLGETTRGDDVWGMTTAFLAAGSRSVVSTLWRVPDELSAELMIAFYEHWRRGMTVGAALQAAQLKLLRSPGPGRLYANWAGYVLTGDPTTTWN